MCLGEVGEKATQALIARPQAIRGEKIAALRWAIVGAPVSLRAGDFAACALQVMCFRRLLLRLRSGLKRQQMGDDHAWLAVTAGQGTWQHRKFSTSGLAVAGGRFADIETTSVCQRAVVRRWRSH